MKSEANLGSGLNEPGPKLNSIIQFSTPLLITEAPKFAVLRDKALK